MHAEMKQVLGVKPKIYFSPGEFPENLANCTNQTSLAVKTVAYVGPPSKCQTQATPRTSIFQNLVSPPSCVQVLLLQSIKRKCEMTRHYLDRCCDTFAFRFSFNFQKKITCTSDNWHNIPLWRCIICTARMV